MLNYFKCFTCLAAFTSKEKKIDSCSCGGKVEFMGEVRGTKYHKHEQHTACDERCTNAAGPNCDCACQGLNHGTGKVIQVEVASGKVIAQQADPKALARALEFITAYKAAEERIQTKYGSILKDIQARVFIADKELYFAALDAPKALRSIGRGKQHKDRISKLNRFLKD